MVQYQQAVDGRSRRWPTPRAEACWSASAAGSATITELAEPFEMSLTGMKKHVRVLEDAELVTTEKVGRARRMQPRASAAGGRADRG